MHAHTVACALECVGWLECVDDGIKCVYCRYNIEQEQRLATETTVLVESYTVSVLYLLSQYLHQKKIF